MFDNDYLAICVTNTVADPGGGGARGAYPPWPVKISHKKDGR